MALSLKNHCVKRLILTGFDDDHSEIVGASIVLRKYRPDWIMYPTYYKDSAEAKRVFALINDEEKTRRASGSPLEKISVRVDQLANRRLRAFRTSSISSCSPRTSMISTLRTTAASCSS